MKRQMQIAVGANGELRMQYCVGNTIVWDMEFGAADAHTVARELNALVDGKKFATIIKLSHESGNVDRKGD